MPRVLTSLIVLLIAAGCGSGGVATTAAGPSFASLAPTVSVAEAAALRDAGGFILDVREPDEWAAGHIPGATLIPLGDLAGRLGEVPRDREIVVVCRSGNRSAQGRDILLEAGFPAVTSLDGGVTDWERAGLPFEAG